MVGSPVEHLYDFLAFPAYFATWFTDSSFVVAMLAIAPLLAVTWVLNLFASSLLPRLPPLANLLVIPLVIFMGHDMSKETSTDQFQGAAETFASAGSVVMGSSVLFLCLGIVGVLKHRRRRAEGKAAHDIGVGSIHPNVQ